MVIARTVVEALHQRSRALRGVLAVWSVEVIRPDGDRDVFAVHRGFVQVAGTKIGVLSMFQNQLRLM